MCITNNEWLSMYTMYKGCIRDILVYISRWCKYLLNNDIGQQTHSFWSWRFPRSSRPHNDIYIQSCTYTVKFCQLKLLLQVGCVELFSAVFCTHRLKSSTKLSFSVLKDWRVPRSHRRSVFQSYWWPRVLDLYRGLCIVIWLCILIRPIQYNTISYIGCGRATLPILVAFSMSNTELFCLNTVV